MKNLFKRIYHEESGVLTFEWILLITVLVIGITGGLSAVRDALVAELGDVASAVLGVNLSYKIAWPVGIQITEPDTAITDYISGSAHYSQFTQEMKDVTSGRPAGNDAAAGDDTGAKFSQTVNATGTDSGKYTK